MKITIDTDDIQQYNVELDTAPDDLRKASYSGIPVRNRGLLDALADAIESQTPLSVGDEVTGRGRFVWTIVAVAEGQALLRRVDPSLCTTYWTQPLAKLKRA